MTDTTTTGAILVQDALGRVRTPREKRQQILDEYERSGMSGAAFAALVGVKYSTLAWWIQQRRQNGLSASLAMAATVRWVEAVPEREVVTAPATIGVPSRGWGGVMLTQLQSGHRRSCLGCDYPGLDQPCDPFGFLHLDPGGQCRKPRHPAQRRANRDDNFDGVFTDNDWTPSSGATYQVVANNRSGRFTNASSAPAPRSVWNVTNNFPWNSAGDGTSTSDTDTDGVVNPAEYFHGLNPRVPYAVAPLAVHSFSANSASVRYRVNSGATDVNGSVEWKPGLAAPAWTNSNVTTNDLSGDWAG